MHSNIWDSFSFSSAGQKKPSQNQSICEPFSPEEFKKKKASGSFKRYDAITHELIEQGQFQAGEPCGKWIQYDQDGDQKIYGFYSQRIGAICNDGSYSSATGRGACSHHGGVSQWLYGSRKVFQKGTGKYQPIEDRLRKVRSQAIKLFGFEKYHNKDELEYRIYKEAVKLKEERNELKESYKKKEELLKEKQLELKQIKIQRNSLQVKVEKLENENKILEEQAKKENYEGIIQELSAKLQKLEINPDKVPAQMSFGPRKHEEKSDSEESQQQEQDSENEESEGEQQPEQEEEESQEQGSSRTEKIKAKSENRNQEKSEDEKKNENEDNAESVESEDSELQMKKNVDSLSTRTTPKLKKQKKGKFIASEAILEKKDESSEIVLDKSSSLVDY